jgi:hypothetical protein
MAAVNETTHSLSQSHIKQYHAHTAIYLYVLSMLLLFCGFYNNQWHVAEQNWFVSHQHDMESYVVGRVAKSHQSGIFSRGGLLGIGNRSEKGPRYRDGLWVFDYQYAAYLNNLPLKSFTIYKSQIGGQGILFSTLSKVIRLAPRLKLTLFYTIASLLSAAVLSLIILWFYRECGLSVSILVLASTIMSPWLVVFGRNLFWSLWAFYLPMVMVMYFLRRHRAATSLPAGTFTCLVFIGVLIKVIFNGYEYITTTLVMLLVPLVFYCALDSRGMRWLLRNALLAGTASGCAILLSLVILCFQIYSTEGSLLSGVNHILFSLMKRTHANALNFPPECAASLQATIGQVVWTYLQGTFFDINNYAVTHNAFIARYVFNIRYSYLLIIFIIATVLFLVRREKPGHSIQWSKCTALVIATWFAVLAPLSWYIIFKAHSFLHTHMNFIVWQMPFTLFGFALCGSVTRVYSLSLIKRFSS